MARTLTILYAAGVFFLLSGVPEGMAAKYVGPDWENRVAVLLVMAVAALGGLTALIARTDSLVRALVAAWPLIAFCALAGASRFWSLAPGDTLRDAVHCSLFVFSGITIAALCDWRAMFGGLAIAGLAIGALCVLLIPFGGLMTEIHVGALAGPFGEKNEAGGVIALSAFAVTAVAIQQRSPVWFLGTLFLVALLALTRSGTSTLAAAIGISTLLAMETLRRGPRRMFLGGWALVAGAVVIGGLLYGIAPDLLTVVGKDMTLTGRSEIWPAVARNIEEQPWLGYGYGGFWQEQSEPMLWLWEEVRFEAHNAHNTVLESLLAVGIPGFVLLTFTVLRTVFYGLINLYGGADRRRYALPFIIMATVMSLTESILSGPDGFVFLVFVVIAVKAAMGKDTYILPATHPSQRSAWR